MDLLITIDANLTVEDNKNRCEVEQDGGFQLDSIQFGTLVRNGQTFTVNKAAFDIESSFKILNELTFVPVGVNDPNAIKAAATAEGRTFICDSQIYVQNHITRVLVFGKKV
jgi:hypothetical protein